MSRTSLGGLKGRRRYVRYGCLSKLAALNPHALVLFRWMDTEMAVAADMAQPQILERPGPSVLQRQNMLDRRRFADIERRAEPHRVTAAPTSLSIPLPQILATLTLSQMLVHPRRQEAFDGFLAHV